MKITSLITAGALASSLMTSVAIAQEAVAPLSDVQKKEIEKVVHDYLIGNPEVLLEASQALQQKQQQSMQQQAQAAIKDNADQLFQGKLAVAGNPKGNVTIVEFFDYQCIHCKKMSPVMAELIKKDSGLRVIYKEFPIFGKSSEYASKAALAAGMQGKYMQMHEALFKIEKHLDEKLVNDAAQSVGLNMSRFKKDMDSKEVADILDSNRKLAEKMRLMGTPALVVAPTPGGTYKAGAEASFIPGGASEDTLKELIKKAAGN